MRVSSKLFVFLVTFLTTPILFTACMDDNGIEGPAGHVMVVNAALGVENGLEVELNGRKANISDVQYTGNSGYLTVNPGDYDLVINESDAGAIYHDPKFEIRGGKNYSLLVFGSDSIKGVQVEDKLDDTADTHAHLRFFNFAENTPMLNLSASTEVSLTPIFQNRSLETLSSAVEHAAFVTIDPGTYSLRLINSSSEESLADPSDMTFEAGKSYTLLASGLAESADTPLKLTMITNK